MFDYCIYDRHILLLENCSQEFEMSCNYVRVCEEAGEEPIELPAEEDNSLLLSTVAAQFPGVSGLKFEIESFFRGVKLSDGRLYPPDGYWGKILYYCVFPKGIIIC